MREANKLDKKIKEIKDIQEQLEYRTKIEEEAIKLTGQCKFEEANKLLDKLS